MKKMSRILGSKMDRQAIYEIYRACRLCGAGAGYKMPIIQNLLLGIDDEVDLRQKIKECVSIEVNQDDKMPPLICELCVDKVTDFYEFLELCRQTNKKTRLKLGLPIQTMTINNLQSNTESVSEQVSTKDNGELPSKNKKLEKNERDLKNNKPKEEVKKETEVKAENPPPPPKVVMKSRGCQTIRIPSPPRVVTLIRSTRQRLSDPQEDVSLSRLQQESVKKPAKTTPKPLLKNDNNVKQKEYISTRKEPISTRKESASTKGKKDEEATCTPKLQLKRAKEKERTPSVVEPPAKKVKIAEPKPLTKPPLKPLTRASPKPVQRQPPRPLSKQLPRPVPNSPPKPMPKSPPTHKCAICNLECITSKAFNQHLKIHYVTYTSYKQACNACSEWFVTLDEAYAHHRKHRTKQIPYRCMLCSTDFVTKETYEEHFAKNACMASTEVPDVKCENCWKYFPTKPLLDQHHCVGKSARPTICIICNRMVMRKNLKRHENDCRQRKGILDSAKVDMIVLRRLKPMQVRVARCDPLLRKHTHGCVDVSAVRHPYGLDKNYRYPYSRMTTTPKLPVKPEPVIKPDNMVTIDEDVKSEFGYIHWDSEDDDNDVAGDDTFRKVPSLVESCVRLIYSPKYLGKVPKKRRIKAKTFDENTEVKDNINNIIDKLKENEWNDFGRLGSTKTDRSKKRLKTGPKDNDSKKSGELSDDYDSDSIINESFRGFDSKKIVFNSIFERSLVESSNNSDDSTSIINSTLKELIRNNETDDASVLSNKKEESLKSDQKNNVQSDPVNDKFVNAENDDTTNTGKTLEDKEQNSSNTNGLNGGSNTLENKIIDSGVETRNKETDEKVKDDLDAKEVGVSDKSDSNNDRTKENDNHDNDLKTIYTNKIEHTTPMKQTSQNNDEDARDNDKCDNGTKINIENVKNNDNFDSINNVISLKLNKENSFIVNNEEKDSRSTTNCLTPEDLNPNVIIDDKKLMEALDAQIGEENEPDTNNDRVNKDVEGDKVGVDCVSKNGNHLNNNLGRFDESVGLIIESSGQASDSVGQFSKSLKQDSDDSVQRDKNMQINEDARHGNETEGNDDTNVERLNDNVEPINDNVGLINDSIGNEDSKSSSSDVFKMLNERIALIDSQVNDTKDSANVFNNTVVSNINDFALSVTENSNNVPVAQNNDKYGHGNDCQSVKDFNNFSQLNLASNETSKVNDNCSENNDKIKEKDKMCLDDLSKTRDTELKGMDLDSVSDAELTSKVNDNCSEYNDKIKEKDKMCLDDLLKTRDAELKGMDLDSVSDDEFDFD